MRERYFRSDMLVWIQNWFWRTTFLLFGIATTLYALDHPAAPAVALWGVITVLLVVSIMLIFIAELFRTAHLFRYWLLSYMLLVILLSTVLLKIYV